MQIEIDFEVFKALTVRRSSEDHTYNQVLRELLDLPESDSPKQDSEISKSEGRLLGGRLLPNGTKLRAKYKGQLHFAHIANNELIDENGVSHRSASAAARSVTNNSVNGLTFWEVRRPADVSWQRLISIPRTAK